MIFNCAIWTLTLAAAWLAVVANAQIVTSVTVHASPSVESTVVTADGALAVLILWRGEPGWDIPAVRGDEHDTRSREYGGSAGGSADGTITESLRRGVIGVSIAYNPRTGVARLGDKHMVVPEGTNVLLIDGVDRPSGPTLVRAFTIDPGGANLDPQDGSLAPLFSRSPEIVSFLRCDVPALEPRLPGQIPLEARHLLVDAARGYCGDLPMR